jgi:hypothetical protein
MLGGGAFMHIRSKQTRVRKWQARTEVALGIAALGGAAVTTGCQVVEREAHAQERPLALAGDVATVTTDDGSRVTGLATGLVGVAYGQEVQLHVTRLPPDPVVPPDPVQPPDPIHLMLSLVDEAGATVADKHVVLEAGRSDTLRVAGSTAFRGRVLLRGGIAPCVHPADSRPPDDDSPPPDDDSPPPDDSLENGGILATLEVVETLTGRTTVVVNPLVLRGFNPQPEPPGAVGP